MDGKNSKNPITLANILIGSGVAFAALFFLGHWHLSWYFKQFGTLIPFYELEPIFIAQIGFFQFLTIGIPIFLFSLFFKQHHKKKTFFVIIVVLFLFTPWILSPYLATYNKAFNATWLSFIFENSVPNVEIAYKVPLASNELPSGSNFDNVSTEIKNEDIKLQDRAFNDDLGNRHYIAQFKLYFESKDNYYLRSNASFCELYGLLAKEALIKEKELVFQENIAKMNPSPLILSTKPDFTISLKDISPEVLNSITTNKYFMENSKSPYIFNLPDTYIIEPINNNFSTSEEQKEYENKRQCKLIILPKIQVESLKYYK